MTGELETAWSGFLYGCGFTYALIAATNYEFATTVVYYLIVGSVYLAVKDKETMVLDAIEAFYRSNIKGEP